MIKYVIINEQKIMHAEGIPSVADNIIWLDLLDGTEAEKLAVEKLFGVGLFSKDESQEIEISSRYIENEDTIGINLNFIRSENGDYISEPISFTIKNRTLITQREHDFRSFTDIYKKLTYSYIKDGDDIFLQLLDLRIDYDADLIEAITDTITVISLELVKNKEISKEILLRITALQETTMMIRENVVEKQRVVSSMMKSKVFPKEDYKIMNVMLLDISSLIEHTGFGFERLEFLQNTFLGLVDMEQNKIVKLFTVVTVIFLPPTLIASMYGMNFRIMPELEWTYGYAFAGFLMVASSVITLLFFRYKKWM